MVSRRARRATRWLPDLAALALSLAASAAAGLLYGAVLVAVHSSAVAAAPPAGGMLPEAPR